jgi:hypothetical protein
VLVILRLDDCQWQIWLVIENKVGTLGLAALNGFSLDDDSSIGERDFFSQLVDGIPASRLNSWKDVFRADVALRELFFVYRICHGCLAATTLLIKHGSRQGNGSRELT